jgi:hypothetical protein
LKSRWDIYMGLKDRMVTVGAVTIKDLSLITYPVLACDSRRGWWGEGLTCLKRKLFSR